MTRTADGASAAASAGARMGRGVGVAAAVQWAMLGPMARVAFAEGVSALTVAFWRATIGALLFAAHAAFTQAPALHRRDRWPAALLGVAGMAVMYVTYFKSVQYGGAALAAILLYAAPVWVALGAHFLLRERVSVSEATALALTLLGVVLVALSGRSASPEAGQFAVTLPVLLFGTLSGLSYAGYFLMGRPLFGRNAPSRVLAWALAAAAVVLLPFVEWRMHSNTAWLAIGFLAVVCTFGAYLCNATGLRSVAASRAATVATLEPVLAVMAAWLVWGERLAPLGMFGALLVVAGIVRSARRAEVPQRDVAQ